MTPQRLQNVFIAVSQRPDLVLEAAVVRRVFEGLQQAAVISHLDEHRVGVNAETRQTFKTQLSSASRQTFVL